MRNIFKIIFIVLCVILYVQNTQANIIRDSEIEETINLVIEPLKKSSGLKDLKIYLINDEIPNAFTAGGMIIFIHSGLIIQFPDPDVLRGVVAHEIGHILGQHVIRREEVINNYTVAAMATAALGLATAIGNIDSGMALLMAGMHVSERSMQNYSRALESSADQAALKLLEKSHQSAIGMVEFFQKTKIQNVSNFTSPYEQTHPLSSERLTLIKKESEKSKYSTSQNTKDLIYKFHRISVKLAAYTLDLEQLPDCDYEENVDEFTHYMKAIKCFRVGNFDDALNHIHRLLLKHPNDPYYHELKAQILFESGKKSSLGEYKIASELKRNDPLILLGKAIVEITFYKNDPAKLNESYKDLSFVLEKEPNNLLALYYMAIYYEKKNLKGKSYLNSAMIANKLGHKKDAKALANAALKELERNTPDWYKASDIIAANK